MKKLERDRYPETPEEWADYWRESVAGWTRIIWRWRALIAMNVVWMAVGAAITGYGWSRGPTFTTIVCGAVTILHGILAARGWHLGQVAIRGRENARHMIAVSITLAPKVGAPGK